MTECLTKNGSLKLRDTFECKYEVPLTNFNLVYLKLAQLNGVKKWPGGGAFAHPAGLTRGAFEQLFGTGGREFDRQKSKNSNAPGVARWGAGGYIEVTN